MAGRIFIDVNHNCRATASVTANSVRAQTTQREQPALVRRATVEHWPALIALDFVSRASRHRLTVSIARLRAHRHRTQGEPQHEFSRSAKIPPQPTEIIALPVHARECVD